MLSSMGAIKDLWQSERGIVTIALIAACTVLCVTSSLTVEQWLEYTKWVFITYAAAKTVTGVAAMATAAKPNATLPPGWPLTGAPGTIISTSTTPIPSSKAP
jgi:hypothetical protein